MKSPTWRDVELRYNARSITLRTDAGYVLTPAGRQALALADAEEPQRTASQYDEVAAARERRELRERQQRANLAEASTGADPWEDRIAQRHRFGREPSAPQPITLGDKILGALIGVTLLVAAVAFGYILGGAG